MKEEMMLAASKTSVEKIAKKINEIFLGPKMSVRGRWRRGKAETG